MSTTMHDLRVSLRDKTKQIDDLERKLGDLKLDLTKRDKSLRDLEDTVKKKDEMIAMKGLIIKEKDAYIRKLETELAELKQPSPPAPHHSTIKSTITSSILRDETNKENVDTTQQQRGITKYDSTDEPYETSAAALAASPIAAGDASRPQKSYNYVLKSKRLAISAEPAQLRQKKSQELKPSLIQHEKSNDTKELLRNAILDNDFMKNLEYSQISKIVDCMYPIEFPKDSLIIKEGDVGNIVFIIEEGRVEVTKNSKILCTMTSGKVFGELAILYNCTRTASVRALTRCRLWAIDRTSYQAIMMRFGIEKHDEYMELLKQMPNFQGLREDVLSKFIDIIDEVKYAHDEYIIRQFAKGDTCFIVMRGQVKVTKSTCKWDEAKFVKYMTRGDFFGENALLDEETRAFSVIVDDPNGAVCLVLDRQNYELLLNDPELSTLKRSDSIKKYKRAQTQLVTMEEEELQLTGIKLSEFEILATLGVGGFGRVELVRNTRDTRTYALKILKKQYVVETKQQEHVLNERNIMIEMRSGFIVRLYKTFKDRKYLYLLLEVCLGGELWTLLRDKNHFDEHQTKFYTACVLEALAYIHARGIVYRDLKPENLLLDPRGYCKLVDFGFAKKIGLGKKTWTFCGTPEYVAPEIILNKGHDVAVDYWSLGVLIFELLVGNPPFAGNDPMSTYNCILKGIDAVDFPRKVPKIAATLIKRLCRENPVDRIGYQRGGIKDVQKHKWFEGFPWEDLRAGSLEAPHHPNVVDNCDLANFDIYPEDTSAPPEDDLTGWDLSF